MVIFHSYVKLPEGKSLKKIPLDPLAPRLPARAHITRPHCSAQPRHARCEGMVQREESRRGAALNRGEKWRFYPEKWRDVCGISWL